MSNTVLLIEDDPDIRTLVELTLRLHGLDVVSCTNGSEGLAEITTREYALVILDVMMPDMSGFELLERLEHTSHTNPIRVAMFTARPLKTLPHHADSIKILGVLPKPFDPAALAESVQTFIAMQS